MLERDVMMHRQPGCEARAATPVRNAESVIASSAGTKLQPKLRI